MKTSWATTSSTEKKSVASAGAKQNRKRGSLPPPVNCSTPKKPSRNINSSTGQVVSDSSKISPEDVSQHTKSCDASSVSEDVSQHTNLCDASSVAEDEVQDILRIQAWKLTSVLQYKGCTDQCAKKLHGLNEYEILSAHSQIASLTNHDKNVWLLQYFLLQCPCNPNGEKDLKRIPYVIHGKEVCFDLWMEILSLTMSRYYRVRREFLTNDGAHYTIKHSRHQQPKTMKAIAWMDSYFQRVGDKRPDKDWIYLPTCLTKSKLYEIMMDDLCQGEVSKGISYAKFCQIFKDDFKNVSIPKVCGLCVHTVSFINTFGL